MLPGYIVPFHNVLGSHASPPARPWDKIFIISADVFFAIKKLLTKFYRSELSVHLYLWHYLSLCALVGPERHEMLISTSSDVIDLTGRKMMCLLLPEMKVRQGLCVLSCFQFFCKTSCSEKMFNWTQPVEIKCVDIKWEQHGKRRAFGVLLGLKRLKVFPLHKLGFKLHWG